MKKVFMLREGGCSILISFWFFRHSHEQAKQNKPLINPPENFPELLFSFRKFYVF